MKKLSDFQNLEQQTRTSISDGIGLDAEDHSLSDDSFEEESIDDSSASLSNQITVKVRGKSMPKPR